MTNRILGSAILVLGTVAIAEGLLLWKGLPLR